MEILAARGWTSYRLSKQLGCKRDTARNWATGENAPGDTYRAALRALVEAGTSETPREKANSALVETFLAEVQAGPVTTLQHRALTRHALERLVRQGVAQRVEVIKEGQRRRDKSRYANPKILVVYARAAGQ